MSEGNWRLEAQVKFEVARNLIEESKADENEPFKAQYAARDILKELKCFLVARSIEEDDDEDPSRIKVMQSGIDYLLGTLHVEIEEWSTGEEYLSSCLKELETHRLNSSCVLITMGNYNQLGILWANRNQPDRSKDYLCQSEKLYTEYKYQTDQSPLTMRQLFSSGDSHPEELDTGESLLEKTHTITLYYLAQVYNSLGEAAKSATYCHNTLKRQLNSGTYDDIDWALNAATLSQYFQSKDKFETARHHLAYASCILNRYERSLKEEKPEEYNEKSERINNRKADIARCWAKYCVVLLTSSHEYLTSLANQENRDCISDEELAVDDSELRFSGADVSVIEDQVRGQHALDFSDAKQVFLIAKHWLDDAKVFYTLQEHASDYVEVQQEISKLYSALIFFESDQDRQCKMHKRRIDILEAVLKELNPQYYLMVCRQLMFELAETYSEMFDIKKALLEEKCGSEPNVHSMAKIKLLINKSIEYYTQFIDSVKEKETKKLPERLADDVVRPTLIAHFCIGRLISKLSGSDRYVAHKNISDSVEYFKFVVDYLTRVPDQMDQAKTEFNVCKEMVSLLKMKLQNM